MDTFVTPIFNMPSSEDLMCEIIHREGYAKIDWYDAIEMSRELALNSNIDPNAFIEIVKNTESPRQLKLILEIFNEYHREHPYGENAYNLLVDYAISSGLGIGSWINALEYFYRWLVANNRYSGLKPMLSYLNSCANTQNLFTCDLRHQLANTLDTYGFQD